MTRISETVATIEQFIEKTSPQIGPMDSMNIQKEFAVLRRAIMRLRDHTETTLGNVQQNMSTDLNALRQAIALVDIPPIESVAPWEIQTEVAKLTQGFTELQTQVQTMMTNDPSALAADIEPLQQQVIHIQEQVCRLQQQNQQIVKPYLKRLTSAVKHLNKQAIDS